MSTAGSEGFLNLLPIYLEHVLYPTLTDASYVTEVHHINGDGEDAGVVYCEMQGRENTGDSRCHLELLREMYPGRCGYKSETGGILKNIRETLSNQKIKEYHLENYRPENLCVIVTGNIRDDDVLNTLMKFEKTIIMRRGVSQNWVRPWGEAVPLLPKSVEKTVEFPCDEEDNGLVYVGWRGPKSTTDFQTSIGIAILMEYMNDTAASPLQQTFVEIDDPFCSSISFSAIEASESCMFLEFESVQKDKLSGIRPELFKLFDMMANSTEPLNMNRMKDIIHRKKLQLLSTLESCPHMAVASAVIGDFLYGNKKEDLEIRLKEIPVLDDYASKDSGFWIDILTKWFIGTNYVCIIGKPSPDLKEKMAQEEKDRVAKQRETLGSDGLTKKADLLNDSKATNEIKPPPEMLSKIPIPSTENIQFFSIQRFNNQSQAEAGNLPLMKVPFRINIDDLKTNFVTFRVLMNSSDALTPEQRLYVPLFCSLLTESSIMRDGTLVPFEDVVTELAADTISNGAGIGVGSYFAQAIILSLKLERGKYVKGVKWLRELLWDTQFTAERVKLVSKRAISDLVLQKRKGARVASDMLRCMNYDNRSNSYNTSTFRQLVFLNQLQKKLETDPQSVLVDLNHVRAVLTRLENLTVHVAVNYQKLLEINGAPDLISPWVDVFLPPALRDADRVVTRSIPADSSLVVPVSENDFRGAIAGVGSVDSNFLHQSVLSMNSFTDNDLPSLLVLIQYLTQLEGPMWRQIRGVGLSYHYSIILDLTGGLLFLNLFKSTHVAAAFKAAQDIVEKHIKGAEKWDEPLLESSRSSLVFELIEREKSLPKVSQESLLNYLRNTDMGYTKALLTKVARVSLSDVKRVAPKYLLPLFDTKQSRCTVCCHPSKVSEVQEAFRG